MAWQMFTPIYLDEAIKISKDLSEGKNIAEHITRLERSRVDAETLAKSNLEAELTRYMNNKEEGESVRDLLRIYMASSMRAEELERKRKQEMKEKLKKEEEEEDEKRTTHTVEASKEPIPEFQGKTKALKCIKNVQKQTTGTKRKIEDRDREEPKKKMVRFEDEVVFVEPSDDKESEEKMEKDSETLVPYETEEETIETEEAEEEAPEDEEMEEVPELHEDETEESDEEEETDEEEEDDDVPEEEVEDPEDEEMEDASEVHDEESDEDEEWVPEEENLEKEVVEDLSFVDPAEKLAEKLKELPSQPKVSDVQNLIRSYGRITPSLLEDAERIIGTELRSVDEVWWHLCLVKFGLGKYKSSFDVRTIYAKELKHQMKKQTRLASIVLKKWDTENYKDSYFSVV